MDQIVQLVLHAGKSAVDLALYVLLPVLVIMMSLMRLLEARGVVAGVSKMLAPLTNRFGIPGLGVFAALQLLFVGFAAPIASLRLMEQNGTSRRRIAATLGMVFAMAQGNVVFPMAAVGLNVGGVLLISIAGGLVASVTTYYLFARSVEDSDLLTEPLEVKRDTKTSTFNLLISGGQDAIDIVLKSLPVVLIAIFVVDTIEFFGIIGLVEDLTAPLFAMLGLSSSSVLPIVTKFMAGGTAMLGVSMELIQEGVLDIADINRLAGFAINPLDLVGIALLASAGVKTASVVRPALAGACCGVMVRVLLHLLIY